MPDSSSSDLSKEPSAAINRSKQGVRPPCVFISYARASDTPFRERLARALARRGIEVRGDWNLAPGPDYQAQLATLIREADVFLAVLSRYSVVSIECRKEIDQADAQKKKLLPILRQAGIDQTQLHQALRQPQWTLLRKVDDWKKGVAQLQTAIATDFDLADLHTWLTQRAVSWEEKGHPASALLRGLELREAENWLPRITANPLELPNVTPLQSTFINASQNARTTTIRHLALAAVTIGAGLLGLTIYAFHQRNEARTQQQIALSRQLAAESELMRAEQPSRMSTSLALAAEAARLHASVATDHALRLITGLSPRAITLPHQKSVATVAIAPSGRIMASGSSDHFAILWNAQTGAALHRLKHGDIVFSVKFSPGGQRLATGSGDGSARLWNVRTGLQLWATPLGATVRSLAFSPDSTTLATAGDDGMVHVLDTANGKERTRLPIHEPAHRVVFSPDGRKLLALGRKSVALYSTIDWQLLAILPHPDSVMEAAFSPDGKLIATACYDRNTWLWDSHTGKDLARLPHGDVVFDLAFSPDGTQLATASFDRTSRVWDVAARREIVSLPHRSAVLRIAFEPGGNLIASGTSDGLVHVWDPKARLEVQRATFEGNINALAFSRDGRSLAVASDSSMAQLLAVKDRSIVRQTSSHGKQSSFTILNGGWAVAFDPGGRRLLTGGDGNSARLSQIHDLRSARTFPTGGFVDAVAFSPDGSLAAIGNRAGVAELWETKTGAIIHRQRHHGPVEAVTFSDDGKYFASVGDDGRIIPFDLTARRKLHQRRVWNAIHGAVFRPASHELVTFDTSHSIKIWSLPDGQNLQTLTHPSAATGYSFSRDGRQLAVSCMEGGALLWDLSTPGQEPKVFEMPLGMSSVALSPSGDFVAVGGAKGSVKIWKRPFNNPVATFHYDGAVHALVFPDEHHLLSACEDQMVHVRDLVADLEIASLIHPQPVNRLSLSLDGRWLASGGNMAETTLWSWRMEDVRREALRRLSGARTDLPSAIGQ